MKVFVSVDMEGIAGVSDWDQAVAKRWDYDFGRKLMTREAGAAVEGAVAAGAEEILVGDSHGSMTNLLPELMPRAARLVQGRCKPLSMLQGVEEGFDAAAFVGYHAMMGTRGGVLSHTYSSCIRVLTVNGTRLGEPGLNALTAAAFGVPLVFLSGDEAACREIESLLPGIRTVAVKKGYGTKTCASVHPEVAREAIRDGVRKALTSEFPPRDRLPQSPFTLEIDLARTEMADLCEAIPGVARRDPTRVEFAHEDFRAVFGAFLTIMRIAGLAVAES